MTIEQFRQSPDLLKRMGEIFDDPVMQQAIVILKDGVPPVDAPVASPEIHSVRVLSQMAGHHNCLSLLLSLSTPIAPAVDLGTPAWEPEPDDVT